MKKYWSIVLLICSIGLLPAQQIDIKVSNKINQTGEPIPQIDQNHYTVHGKSRSYFNMKGRAKLTLSKFDADLHPVGADKSLEIMYNGQPVYPDDWIKTNKYTYVSGFGADEKNRMAQLVISKFESNGNYSKPVPIADMAFSYSYAGYLSGFVNTSPDKKLLYTTGVREDKVEKGKKANQVVMVSVMDEDLKPVWSVAQEFPFMSSEISLTGAALTNSGEVVLVQKINVKGGRGYEAHTYKAYVLNNGKLTELDVNPGEGKVATQVLVAAKEDGTVAIVGLYNNIGNKMDAANGTYCITIDCKNATIAHKDVNKFSAELMATEGQEKRKVTNEGITYQTMFKLMALKDNSVTMVSHRTYTVQTKDYSATYFGDMLAVGYDAQGNKSFDQVIPTMDGFHNSYATRVSDNNVILLYEEIANHVHGGKRDDNDVAVLITPKGELKGKAIIPGLQGFDVAFGYTVQDAENKLTAVAAHGQEIGALGMLITLTVKGGEETGGEHKQ